MYLQLNYNFALCIKVTSSKEISLLNLNIVLIVFPVPKLQSRIQMYQNSYGTELQGVLVTFLECVRKVKGVFRTFPNI